MTLVVKLVKALRTLCTADRAQDIVEWALLLAFVVLGGSSLMLNSGGSVSNIWNSANSALQPPASSASMSPGTANPPAPPRTRRSGGYGGWGSWGGWGGRHHH